MQQVIGVDDEPGGDWHKLPVADYLKKSPYRPIWDAFLAGRYELCVSNEILDEYQEILGQPQTAQVTTQSPRIEPQLSDNNYFISVKP